MLAAAGATVAARNINASDVTSAFAGSEAAGTAFGSEVIAPSPLGPGPESGPSGSESSLPSHHSAPLVTPPSAGEAHTTLVHSTPASEVQGQAGDDHLQHSMSTEYLSGSEPRISPDQLTSDPGDKETEQAESHAHASAAPVYDAQPVDAYSGDAVNAIPVDLNGDGIVDGVASDTNGDGLVDAVAVDVNGDGIMDAVAVDVNGDGYVDAVAVDADGNGYADVAAVDLDGDGDADAVGLDTNADGVIDTYAADLDNDGLVDEVGYDIDGDGQADFVATDDDYEA